MRKESGYSADKWFCRLHKAESNAKQGNESKEETSPRKKHIGMQCRKGGFRLMK